MGIGEPTPPSDSPANLLRWLDARLADGIQAVRYQDGPRRGRRDGRGIGGSNGLEAISRDCDAPAGVGVLQPDACSETPLLLIKPGSYDWPDEIWQHFRTQIVCQCGAILGKPARARQEVGLGGWTLCATSPHFYRHRDGDGRYDTPGPGLVPARRHHEELFPRRPAYAAAAVTRSSGRCSARSAWPCFGAAISP